MAVGAIELHLKMRTLERVFGFHERCKWLHIQTRTPRRRQVRGDDRIGRAEMGQCGIRIISRPCLLTAV
jgi:hypothetical protein